MTEEGKRAGIIVPATNTTVEEDFAHVVPQLLPHRIYLHFARAQYPGTPRTGPLRAMKESAIEEARKMAKVHLDMLAYACTSGSFLEGIVFEDDLRKSLRKAALDLPVVTAASSSVSALKNIGARSISFISPYHKEIHNRGVNFFRDSGFSVIKNKCLGFSQTDQIARTSTEAIKQLVKQALDNSIDAVFVSCTNFPIFMKIPAFENEFQIPVLSSNQALLWDIVRTLAPGVCLKGLGRLFR